MSVEVVEREGRRFAVIPLEEYEALVEKAEMLEDIAAHDRAVAALERGESELVPEDIVERLASGEHPVRVWRIRRGLGQRELARRAGISQGYLAQIEGGRRRGSVATLRRLAAALGVDLEDLAD